MVRMLQATATASKKLAVVIGETEFEWLLVSFVPSSRRKLGEPTLVVALIHVNCTQNVMAAAVR